MEIFISGYITSLLDPLGAEIFRSYGISPLLQNTTAKGLVPKENVNIIMAYLPTCFSLFHIKSYYFHLSEPSMFFSDHHHDIKNAITVCLSSSCELYWILHRSIQRRSLLSWSCQGTNFWKLYLWRYGEHFTSIGMTKILLYVNSKNFTRWFV